MSWALVFSACICQMWQNWESEVHVRRTKALTWLRKWSWILFSPTFSLCNLHFNISCWFFLFCDFHFIISDLVCFSVLRKIRLLFYLEGAEMIGAGIILLLHTVKFWDLYRNYSSPQALLSIWYTDLDKLFLWMCWIVCKVLKR